MFKWDKLNRELDSALEKMTETDWKDWHAHREANRELRKGIFQLEAEMHLAKMLLANSPYKLSFFEQVSGSQVVEANLTSTNIDFEVGGLSNSTAAHIYAIAA